MNTTQLSNFPVNIELSSALDNWENLAADLQNEIVKNILRSLEEQNYPFYESDSKVILFYYNGAENVRLVSDITGWTDPIPFRKLPGKGLFFLPLELEPDARIEYQLIVDGKILCDPFNKYLSSNGLGALSELAMPGYVRHPYHNEFLHGRVGTFEGLIKHTLPAGILPYEHEVYVYLPVGYDTGKSYPVIYFHDGPDYINYALAPYTIDRMISEIRIQPCIAVFVTPPNLHQPAVPNRSTEYGMNDNYVSFFCDELIKFIDKNYSTENSAKSRLVTGDSYAGLISLYIAFSRPDLFANAYSQSGYFSFRNDKIIKLIRENETKPINLFLDIGTYEEKVGADFLPSAELDFTSANSRMEKELMNKGYNYIYKEYHEGHTWGNWRRHLIDALEYFFPVKEQ